VSIFSGMSRDQLTVALASAQLALIDFQLGKAYSTLSYTQGDGAKSVTKRVTSVTELTQLILQLQRALGIGCRRRMTRFVC
jgi:hypothetical protein